VLFRQSAHKIEKSSTVTFGHHALPVSKFHFPDPTPSRTDVEMTQTIVARPLGIAVHEHIIDGKDGHAGLKALKLI
jgi:DNA repair protein RadC